ncbi:hypothetical protein AGABI2DRAFT_191198, partial [Agaricus bisporus var. bisporus H97]|uniref:hypothetical protein n=1 Tax=Agaricus bisporus var. bisporus (strain H97 / ATCC MYA-4626 / FGSC 10389) TaxID=936046 RepID=UPI00029F6EBA
MREEGEMLGLDDQGGEEGEKQIAVGDSTNLQGTTEPPRTPSPSPSQPENSSELPTRDPSPEYGSTKVNNHS